HIQRLVKSITMCIIIPSSWGTNKETAIETSTKYRADHRKFQHEKNRCPRCQCTIIRDALVKHKRGKTCLQARDLQAGEVLSSWAC
ncbi:MAG: hypothetical protein ACKPKO_40655, partial [Candidatus Fonsibacter sp.]